MLDSMLERMKVEESLDIFAFICEMRKKRVLMVQTEVLHACICIIYYIGGPGVAWSTRQLGFEKRGHVHTLVAGLETTNRGLKNVMVS